MKADPDNLNNHFSSTAQRLLGSMPLTKDKLGEMINSLPAHEHLNLFNLRQVIHTEVLKELTTMRNDSSMGPDQIPAKYLKLVAEYIASPLTHIINSFISCQRFPDAWKQARVSPIPKITNPTEADHFRLISILPVLSKVYERLVLYQLLTYINQLNVLNANISGYCKGHSTTTVLLQIRDDIIPAMKKEKLTLIAFADFSNTLTLCTFTTLYDHCSPKDLITCSNRMEATMSQLESWASESDLLMNGNKTKQMLLTTSQMSKAHNR